jgi:DnaJ-class molecular chaperone
VSCPDCATGEIEEPISCAECKKANLEYGYIAHIKKHRPGYLKYSNCEECTDKKNILYTNCPTCKGLGIIRIEGE